MNLPAISFWSWMAELAAEERAAEQHYAEECAIRAHARQYSGPRNFEEYMEEWFYYWHREMDSVFDPIGGLNEY